MEDQILLKRQNILQVGSPVDKSPSSHQLLFFQFFLQFFFHKSSISTRSPTKKCLIYILYTHRWPSSVLLTFFRSLQKTTYFFKSSLGRSSSSGLLYTSWSLNLDLLHVLYRQSPSRIL